MEALKALARERFPALFHARRKSKGNAKEAGITYQRRNSSQPPELDRRRSSHLENKMINEHDSHEHSFDASRGIHKDKQGHLSGNSSALNMKKEDDQDAMSEYSDTSSVLNKSFDKYLIKKKRGEGKAENQSTKSGSAYVSNLQSISRKNP